MWNRSIEERLVWIWLSQTYMESIVIVDLFWFVNLWRDFLRETALVLERKRLFSKDWAAKAIKVTALSNLKFLFRVFHKSKYSDSQHFEVTLNLNTTATTKTRSRHYIYFTMFPNTLFRVHYSLCYLDRSKTRVYFDRETRALEAAISSKWGLLCSWASVLNRWTPFRLWLRSPNSTDARF